MKQLFAVILMVIGLTGPASAQDANAIQGVIADQLADFVARDVDGAWQHASPMIQGIFGTPQNFGTMVERGYPMVWDNSDVRFGELREVAGNLWQRVTVRDAAGNLHSLDYQMIETPDGWQINGVQLLPPADIGV